MLWLAREYGSSVNADRALVSCLRPSSWISKQGLHRKDGIVASKRQINVSPLPHHYTTVLENDKKKKYCSWKHCVPPSSYPGVYMLLPPLYARHHLAIQTTVPAMGPLSPKTNSPPLPLCETNAYKDAAVLLIGNEGMFEERTSSFA